MDGKTEEWEGWLNKKKGQKNTPLKEDIPRTSVQLWGKKKTNQKATMMKQPTTFTHLCKNLHIYMSRN